MTSTATIIRCTGKFQTPGPGAYMPPSDFGKAPAYTIKHRYQEKTNVNTAGYQCLENTVGQGRKWSLSSRHKERDYVAAPGPSYVPPKFGQDAPTSTFHQRTEDRGPRALSPGPGKYNTRADLGGKKYTMKARQFPPDEGDPDGPGTGKYLPDYSKVLKKERQSGIGPRLKDPKGDVTPGPGQYHIDRRPQTGPQAFHIKQREFNQDNFPGPKYDTSTRTGVDSPKYSMRSRIDQPFRPIAAPYQKIPDKFAAEAPKWSLSSRHPEQNREPTPGPAYIPPDFGKDGQKYSMTSRREKKRDIALEPPGPKYDCRPTDTGHKFTMKARQFPPDEGGPDGPGAGKYLPDYDKVLHAAQKTQILEKFQPKKQDPPPGYVDLGSTLTGKGITIGRKEYLAVAPGVG